MNISIFPLNVKYFMEILVHQFSSSSRRYQTRWKWKQYKVTLKLAIFPEKKTHISTRLCSYWSALESNNSIPLWSVVLKKMKGFTSYLSVLSNGQYWKFSLVTKYFIHNKYPRYITSWWLADLLRLVRNSII